MRRPSRGKIFDNDAFGYWKVTVERPLRIAGADPNRAYKVAEIKKLKESGQRSETAPPVIRKIHKRGTDADPLHGRFAATIDGRPGVVEYEPDTDLRDTEQIPLHEAGGIEAFLHRDVLPYAADAWYRPDSVRTGYEISFTRYFYNPKPMRTLEEIRANILALERETVGLLSEITARYPYVTAARMRVYADTCVIGGCEDDEFRGPSRQLMNRFIGGEMTLALSSLTLRELEAAPQPVRKVLEGVPSEHTEMVDLSDDAEKLAAQYIERGVIRFTNDSRRPAHCCGHSRRSRRTCELELQTCSQLDSHTGIQHSKPRNGVHRTRHTDPEGDLR